MHQGGGRVLLQRSPAEVPAPRPLHRRASFGTTKYCNSFIRGATCMNAECLYLHHKAPAEDCFLRDEMTAGDSTFYKRTHPGFGSYWDSRHGLFVYHRRNAMRSGSELPANEGNAEEISNCLKRFSRIRFGLNGREYEVRCDDAGDG